VAKDTLLALLETNRLHMIWTWWCRKLPLVSG